MLIKLYNKDKTRYLKIYKCERAGNEVYLFGQFVPKWCTINHQVLSWEILPWDMADVEYEIAGIGSSAWHIKGIPYNILKVLQKENYYAY